MSDLTVYTEISKRCHSVTNIGLYRIISTASDVALGFFAVSP